MAAVTELATDVGTRAACRALFAPRASYYRDRRAASFTAATALRPRPARALSPEERKTVLDHLHGERFQDRSPAAVYATLLDEGHYYCSIRTMHRFLKQQGESRERRDQLTHPHYQKPELLATAPNQLWSWDITKLLGPFRGLARLREHRQGSSRVSRGLLWGAVADGDRRFRRSRSRGSILFRSCR